MRFELNTNFRKHVHLFKTLVWLLYRAHQLRSLKYAGRLQSRYHVHSPSPSHGSLKEIKDYDIINYWQEEGETSP